MSEETKRRIIEAGAELVHQQGFNNTGLKDILRAADVPKGSFYFYFDNKEAFGIEMVNYFGERFRSVVEPIINDESRSALERLRAVFEAFHSYFEAHDYSRGCPVGNLAQEMGDLSTPFRTKLKEAMDGMVLVFMRLLRKAQQGSEVPDDLDIRETATFLVEAWHGAIIRMKVEKTAAPLEICYKFIFEKLLK